MKRILSLILSAAAVLTFSATVCSAESTAAPTATITFDTETSLEYVHTFGNAAETNLLCEISDSGAVSGRCLKLSEDFESTVGNQYGGIYFDAADFDIDSFAGYTMTVYIKTNSASAKASPTFLVFADGEQWVSENFSTSSTGSWVAASVSVPADKINTKLGISIPITEPFSGEVALIDNVTIVDNYGKAIANIGDLDTSIAQAPSTFVSVITTILFILLILAVIAAVGLLVVKLLRRYR